MKFTNEQHEKIGRDVVNEMLPHLPNGITWIHEYRGDEKAALLAAGRAAVAAVAPLLLAELQHASDVEWSSLATFYQVKGLFLISFADLNVFLRNRLASVTAKPDPAVEAVEAMPELNGWSEQARKSAAERIVAAVDAARAK